MAMCDATAHIIQDDGQFPNCSIQNLPVLIYKSAFPASDSPSQLANKIEQTFESNGFPPQWRFGLYEYPHYHSTSHEILGVFKGSARVRCDASLFACTLYCMTAQIHGHFACAVQSCYTISAAIVCKPMTFMAGLAWLHHGHHAKCEVKVHAHCRLGGAKCGVEEEVSAGDVMLIPAGVAHERCALACPLPKLHPAG